MPVSECVDCGTPMPLIRKPATWRQALWGGWTCPRCGSEYDRWSRKIGEAGAPRRTQTLDDSTRAAQPGGVALSDAKLRRLRPDLYGLGHRLRAAVGLDFPWLVFFREHLQNGDSRAAVVVSLRPLLVAAFTDELDCIALLEFPEEFASEYALRDGTRLLTVNTYKRREEYDADLIPGPDNTQNWSGFQPIIAEFVSDDRKRIERRKAQISDAEWQRAYAMGKAYMKRRPGVWRDGRPGHSFEPAE
jgi:hypothetical protein